MSPLNFSAKNQEHSAHGAYPCDTCEVREISACASLNADEMFRLTSIMQTVTITPHRLIFVETDPAKNVFNLTEGVVKIYKMMVDGRRQVTGFLFPGDFLGLVHNESYAYTAETVTKSKLCQFPRRQLEALLNELPNLEQRLLAMASHELAAAQDQMILLGRKSARERVASFLLMLSKAAERQGHRNNPILIPMPRTDIADYLGLSTETISRTFTEFNGQGLIHLMNDRHVQLVDPAAMYKVAAGI
jgi:CRP/FNR family transcriptional regulator